ncbi:MAG: hypothetical protein ACYS9T_11135 [Planctomycetota bacterium]|jgi:hypothetical protein
MADSDYNIIKPVEGLQNIAGLTPARRREERRRRRELRKGKEQDSEQRANESSGESSVDIESAADDSEQHSIDYCA